MWENRITLGTALSFIYWQWTMRCNLTHQDDTTDTAFNTQLSNKIRLIKAGVKHYIIKNKIKEWFLKGLFVGVSVLY